MFSPQALQAFKNFCKVDRATRPEGAHDSMPPRLKALLGQLAPAERQALLIALDADPPVQATVSSKSLTEDDEHDHKKVAALMSFLGDKLDEDDIGNAMRLLDEAFPGCVGDLAERGEANEGAEDEPGPTPGTPRPGGSHWPLAHDAALRVRAAETYMANSADFERRYPMTKRLGIV